MRSAIANKQLVGGFALTLQLGPFLFGGDNDVNGQFRQLSAMITWGLDTYEDFPLAGNPCQGFRKPTAPPPTRYVTDQEYHAQIEYSCAKGFKWLAIFFELAYLLASRSIEVRSLTLDDVGENGILVERKAATPT